MGEEKEILVKSFVNFWGKAKAPGKWVGKKSAPTILQPITLFITNENLVVTLESFLAELTLQIYLVHASINTCGLLGNCVTPGWFFFSLNFYQIEWGTSRIEDSQQHDDLLFYANTQRIASVLRKMLSLRSVGFQYKWFEGH